VIGPCSHDLDPEAAARLVRVVGRPVIGAAVMVRLDPLLAIGVRLLFLDNLVGERQFFPSADTARIRLILAGRTAMSIRFRLCGWRRHFCRWIGIRTVSAQGMAEGNGIRVNGLDLDLNTFSKLWVAGLSPAGDAITG
jgi:hypothetical protein